MSIPSGGVRGDLTEELIAADWWYDQMVAAAGIPVLDIPLVSVGGGLGSFALVDLLRISGVPVDRVRVLTAADYPWQQYEYLTQCSQLGAKERLRSDSSSIPDNIWGFPGLALREAWKEKTLVPLLKVATEPLSSGYWTPRIGTVLEGLRRESARIGWNSMVLKGQVRMVRRRVGGGYFVILTPPQGATTTRRVAIRAQHVHLAVGYPGVKFLDDLQQYRETSQDTFRVVNAYEPHEHVYDELIARPGIVVIRGSGVVASRVLQRLIDDREKHGARTTILHIFRTYVAGAHGGTALSRRRGGHGWAHQAFTYPKAVWGGHHAARLRSLKGADRAAYYQQIGGTTTPRRRSWQEQLSRGRYEGWYRVFVGRVQEVVPGTNGTVISKLIEGDDETVHDVPASFIIDCTGLEGDLREHRVLADLLEHGGARRNPLGRLDIDPQFAIRGSESPPGKLYVSGSMALGGHSAGVDTFLGLQSSALDIVDDLAGQKFCPRIGTGRSVAQWWRRMNGKSP